MISVIVPVYNAEKFLENGVRSLLADTSVEQEIILVNDKSTDGSDRICRSLAEKFPDVVRYIPLEKNGGVSAARNIGIENAKGEYIAFLDADDEYLPGALGALLRLAERHPEAGIVSGGIVKGPELRVESVKAAEEKTLLISAEEALRLMLYQRPEGDHSSWAKLFRRELFDDIRFKEGIRFEDMEIYPRLLRKAGKVVLYSGKVYFYRTNPVSFLNSWTPARLDSLDVAEAIIGDTKREGNPTLTRAARSLKLSNGFNAFLLASAHGETEDAERAWRIIREERLGGLTDPRVRLKNKIGILLSFLGPSALKAVGSLKR